jgi:periplasmic protein TonB
MALARMTLVWSLLAHGGMVAGLLWFGPGAAMRTRSAPPLVQIEWRQTAAVAAAVAPVEMPVEIEPVRSEPVVEAMVDDALQPAPRPEVDCDEHDHEPNRRCAPPPFAELRRSLRHAPPPAVAQLPAPPPVPTAAEPSARVLVPIAGTTIAPRYPASARRRGQEGTVLLAVTVAVDGSVRDALVVRSSGHAVLDDEAVHTVRQWRFAGGPGVCEQAIEFRLRAAAGA